MKVSTRWLSRYLDIRIDGEELCEVFTSIWLEVEGIEHLETARQ
jgi:hypothetical protein